ncbi:MAG: hypothetical protein ACK4LQ_03060 [Pararhodobacter sp.]
MNDRAIAKKLKRLRASDERHGGRTLTVRASHAAKFFNPETGRAEGPESPFARVVLKREKEAARWKA